MAATGNPLWISMGDCVGLILESSNQMEWELMHPISMNPVWPPGNMNFTAFPGCTCMWLNSGGPRQQCLVVGWDLSNIYYTVQFPYSLSNKGSSIYHQSPHSEDLSECPGQGVLDKCIEWTDKSPPHQHDKINTFIRFLLLCNTEG